MENTELLLAIGALMDEKLQPINERLTKIEITLENDISTKLGALFDGHQLDSEKLSKLDAVETTVEETKSNVDVMFKVIQEHSGEIKELKNTK